MDSTSQLELTARNSHELLGWNVKTIGALLGLGGGMIAPIAGSVLTVLSWFTGSVWHGLNLHRDGTIAFVSTFPLLVVGAHCLDLIEKQIHREKLCFQFATPRERPRTTTVTLGGIEFSVEK